MNTPRTVAAEIDSTSTTSFSVSRVHDSVAQLDLAQPETPTLPPLPDTPLPNAPTTDPSPDPTPSTPSPFTQPPPWVKPGEEPKPKA